MKKLLVYLKEYRKESILGPLFKLLEAAFELLVPLVVASIVDRGIKGENRPYVLKMCLLMAALGLIGFACSVTAQFFAAKAATGFVKKILHTLFAHIETLSYSDLDGGRNSTLITRMTSDVNQIQNAVNLTLRLLLRSPFVVFGAMIMAFTIDKKLALIFLALIPVLSIIVFGIMLFSIPMYRKVQGALDRVTGITRENLTGVRVIRAFCKEKEEEKSFREKAESLTSLQKSVGHISALMNPLTYILLNLAIILLLWGGGLRVNAGVLSTGSVVALYNYLSQILVELIKMANLIINITKGIACGNRVQSILEMEPAISYPREMKQQPKEKGTVTFQQVGMQYPGAGEESLSNLSFSVKSGEIIGIIGGTGSGKSTLVNLLPRFYEATTGSIEIDGINIKEYTKEELRKRIGVVPQKAILFRGTIEENIRWGKKDATREEVEEAISLAQGKEIIQGKEEGLQYLIEQNGRNLSGGQKQRLTIARALVGQPEILILDDSSSALDFATEAALRKALQSLPQKPTIFLVSQRATSLMHAHKILVLEDGELVGTGTHEELMKSCEVYREIYQSQNQERKEA